MATPEAAREHGRLKATGLALAIVFGAWCAPPVFASTGVVIECEEAEKMPAIVETASQAVADEADESDVAEESSEPASATPAVSTRLPGVSKSALPSFRRQMLRTDI